jgi:hypothetical protein
MPSLAQRRHARIAHDLETRAYFDRRIKELAGTVRLSLLAGQIRKSDDCLGEQWPKWLGSVVCHVINQ